MTGGLFVLWGCWYLAGGVKMTCNKFLQNRPKKTQSHVKTTDRLFLPFFFFLGAPCLIVDWPLIKFVHDGQMPSDTYTNSSRQDHHHHHHQWWWHHPGATEPPPPLPTCVRALFGLFSLGRATSWFLFNRVFEFPLLDARPTTPWTCYNRVFNFESLLPRGA
jgi:hypothetical protein